MLGFAPKDGFAPNLGLACRDGLFGNVGFFPKAGFAPNGGFFAITGFGFAAAGADAGAAGAAVGVGAGDAVCLGVGTEACAAAAGVDFALGMTAPLLCSCLEKPQRHRPKIDAIMSTLYCEHGPDPVPSALPAVLPPPTASPVATGLRNEAADIFALAVDAVLLLCSCFKNPHLHDPKIDAFISSLYDVHGSVAGVPSPASS